MQSTKFDTSSINDLRYLAQQLTKTAPQGSWVFLKGDLGAGKTTFSQLFIAEKGYKGTVTSPTYALMNNYSTTSGEVIHCDLYRLSEPEELYEIGLLDLATEENATVLVEWPSKGEGVLPQPDIIIEFSFNVVGGEVKRLTTVYSKNSAIVL